MKLMISGGVFGDFRLLRKDARFVQADYIFLTGNTGITANSFSPGPPTYFVAGKNEDFGAIKQISESPETTDLSKSFCFVSGPCIVGDKEEVVSVYGVSGTYSPNFYEADSAPIKHMRKKDLFGAPNGTDILLLHNIPGKLAKSGTLDFDSDFFNLLNTKSFRYVFIGGYEFKKFTSFKYRDTTVLFLPSLVRGYALVDTQDWSCYFQNKLTD